MLREQGKHKEPMRSRNQFNLSSLSDFYFFYGFIFREFVKTS